MEYYMLYVYIYFLKQKYLFDNNNKKMYYKPKNNYLKCLRFNNIFSFCYYGIIYKISSI